MVAFATAAPSAFLGETVRLTARVRSAVAQPVDVLFINRGVVEKAVHRELAAGQTADVDADVPLQAGGASVWTAEIRAARDHFPQNSRLTVSIDVRGRPRILAIHKEPALLRALDRALHGQQIDFDVCRATGLPIDVGAMQEFDAIILAGVPATELSTRQMEAVRRYVTDCGGGAHHDGQRRQLRSWRLSSDAG